MNLGLRANTYAFTVKVFYDKASNGWLFLLQSKSVVSL